MAGTGRVTAADVARSLGLSRATVGFVLNDTPGQTISAATRERVFAEAARMGYRPHSAARALASGRSHIVLLLLPEWPVDFALRTNIEEAAAALDRAGYSLVTHTPSRTSRARPLWEMLQPDVVVSLLPLDADLRDRLLRAGVNNIVPDPDEDTANAYVDPGPALQIRHLVSLGHHRIGYVGIADPRLADLSAARLAGATATAAELGVELVPLGGLTLDDPAAGALVETGRREGISAVATYNDDVAIAVVGAALRRGVRVPAELAVVGHDDTPVASLVEPRLSSIHVDVTGLGRYLAALALSRVGREVPTPVEPARTAEVVRRHTT